MLLPANSFAASLEDFSDFPTDWSAAGLRRAVDNGLLNGSGGKINGSGKLIRAQMAAIINRAFAAHKTADLSVYSDANASAWYYNDLELAVAMRTFQGANGKLNPEAPITREEAFAVLARAFTLENGDVSVLNNYTDGASVSAWAKGSVAALIENGYVNGADGKLNPKNSITRAEFAKVISEMASTYADADDSLSDTVDGSVIVRENGVSLTGKTINGDLIIADGVSKIDLTGVTVTGRIVLRGGESGVTFKDTKAGKGVIANTDVAVSGSVDSITVAQGSTITVNSGASVGTINANAEGAKITGAGKVENVKANADNVTVTTTGTKVSAADSVSGVKAGDKTVGAGKTETVGTATSGGAGGSAGGGSSSGGSSSGGSSSGGSSSGGSTARQNLVVAEQTKLIDMDTVNLGALGQFVVVHFEKGNNLDNCTLTVNGAEINSACTDVSTDGSIVKWQSTVLNPSTLTVTNKTNGKTQTINLGGTNTATPTVSGKPQDYNLLAHGPVYVWDYHQTNKDSAGNVRVSPSHTTIDTAAASNTIRFYSPDAELHPSDTGYFATGTVELMFNYANGTQEERDWVDGINTDDISSVVLLQDDESNSELNTNLTWELDKAYQHGTQTVACIKVPIGQSNFFSNGRYKLRVVSNGKAEVFPIHVVNETIPSMVLSDTDAYSGVNTHFHVKDMLYGITQPIYRVELKYENEEPQVLEKIDDWYLIGDTFVLYNDKTNHLSRSGNYTLTIYADGFKSFSKTFSAIGDSKNTATPSARAAAAGVDALSAATSGGGGATSDSGSEGGSNTMNANLIFSADLLTNAKIVEKLGLDSQYASAISARWDEMSHDSVYFEGAEQVYTCEGFFDAANTARTEKKLLTFAEYVNGGKAETTLNHPYAVKKVLEDNLLGETTSFSESSSVAAPDLIPVKRGEDGKFEHISAVNEDETAITLLISGDKASAYAAKLAENGKLYLNGNTVKALTPDEDYTVNTADNTITVYTKNLKLGDNSLQVAVDTFQTVHMTLIKSKVIEENLSLSANSTSYERKEPIELTINNSDGDFLSNLQSVSVDGKAIYDKSSAGDSADYYEITGKNTLKIYDKQGTLFSANKDYTITLKANYYSADGLSVKVHVESDFPNAPAMDIVTGVADTDGVYRISFNSKNNSSNVNSWRGKVNHITVNEVEYTAAEMFNSPKKDSTTYKWNQPSEWYIDLGGNAFHDGENTVIFSAEGYQDLVVPFTLNSNSGESGDNSSDNGNSGGNGGSETPDNTEIKVPTTAPTLETRQNGSYTDYYALVFSESDKAWISKVTSVTVNNSTCSPVDSGSNVDSSGKYYLNKNEGSIGVYWMTNFVDYPFDIVLSTENNGSLTLTVSREGYSTPTVAIKESTPSNGDNTGDNGSTGNNGNSDTESTLPTSVSIAKVTNNNTYYTLTFNNAEWVGKVSGISIKNKDTIYTPTDKISDIGMSNKYYLDKENSMIALYINTFSTPCDLIISATGYEDLTVHVVTSFTGDSATIVK